MTDLTNAEIAKRLDHLEIALLEHVHPAWHVKSVPFCVTPEIRAKYCHVEGTPPTPPSVTTTTHKPGDPVTTIRLPPPRYVNQCPCMRCYCGNTQRLLQDNAQLKTALETAVIDKEYINVEKDHHRQRAESAEQQVRELHIQLRNVREERDTAQTQMRRKFVVRLTGIDKVTVHAPTNIEKTYIRKIAVMEAIKSAGGEWI